MNSPITRFNFTYAAPDGAWIERESGERSRQWVPWHLLRAEMGQTWIDRQIRKQGWCTGTWITVEEREAA